MKTENPFEQIQASAGNAVKSYQWYQAQIRKLGLSTMKPAGVFKSEIGEFVPRVRWGDMYLFYYTPKGKDTLPYYDLYPLVFPFRVTADGFVGLNMHYLPPLLRMKLMGRLLQLAEDTTLTETTRLRLTWNIIGNASRFPEAAPCVKRYLLPHVRSRFLKINPPDWKAAIMLPIEGFQKETRNKIYRQSQDKINA